MAAIGTAPVSVAVTGAITVLRAAAMFDGISPALIADPVVVVADGVILAVHGPAGPVPPGASVIDLPGLTLMPGLVDTHLHLCFDASEDPIGHLAQADDDVLRERMADAARRALRGGVTTVRDLGDRGYLALDLRDRAPAIGADPLPTIVAAGPPITTPGGHCHFLGGAASGKAGLRGAVRERAERGADVIKVMASGGNLTPGSVAYEPQFGAEELRVIVDEAHCRGLPVTAHAHGAQSVADAAAAGVDGVEHATFMTSDGVDAPDALIRTIAAQRIAVGWTVGRDPAAREPLFPQIASRIASLASARRRVYESGAVLLAGSDAGVSPAKPHDVLSYAQDDLARVGLTPAEILCTMTSRAAQACGLGHRKGCITSGFDADILVIDGNPLEDLAAIRRLHAVYAGGRAVLSAPASPAEPSAGHRGPSRVPAPAATDQGTDRPRGRDHGRRTGSR
jgi:imidazolonepropionase-like amidohydrolase